MELDVVTCLHGTLELAFDRAPIEAIVAFAFGVLLELQDLADVGHDRQLRAGAVELVEHARRRVDDEVFGRPHPTAMDLVIGREENPVHEDERIIGAWRASFRS